jgi:hypothetical protein
MRAESGWFGRGIGDRGLCGAVASISGAGTVGIPDWNDWSAARAGAGIAVRRIETEDDHGERQWERQDVSQENRCGLQERGTTAIRRMMRPQSGQMVKSAAVSGRSPRCDCRQVRGRHS